MSILAYVNVFSIELALMNCLEIKNENCSNTSHFRLSNPKFNDDTIIFVTQGYMARIIDDMGSSIIYVGDKIRM